MSTVQSVCSKLYNFNIKHFLTEVSTVDKREQNFKWLLEMDSNFDSYKDKIQRLG